jgi:hypothetical protein
MRKKDLTKPSAIEERVASFDDSRYVINENPASQEIKNTNT